MVGPAVSVSVFVAAGKRMGFGSFYWYILAIRRDLMLSVPYSRNLGTRQTLVASGVCSWKQRPTSELPHRRPGNEGAEVF